MSKHPLHKEDIKAAIRKRYGSLRAFEKFYGLPDQSARDVLRGRAISRTAQIIADDLGFTIEKLFPGRFKSHIRDNSQVSRTKHRINAEVQ